MTDGDSFLAAMLPVLEAAGQLKSLDRAGWVRVGLPHPESVADHSYRLAVLCLLIGPRLGLNADTMIRLALLHDLAEARVGDLTPVDRVTSEEKRAREAVAFAEIVEALPEGLALNDLWREYEAGATPEARIVRQLDKLEMALQALDYERQFGARPMIRGARAARRRGRRALPEKRDEGWADEFWATARAALTEPLLIQFYDYLWAQRPR